MKKMFYLFAILLSLTSVAAYADNDKITNDTRVLPAISREFIATHFQGNPISHIKIEKDFLRVDSYDVILTDGTNIEFNRQGEWTEVNRHDHAVPQAIVPAVIRTYVEKHYPACQIIVIEKDNRDYEIKLTNGLELKFDLQGNLIDIDN